MQQCVLTRISGTRQGNGACFGDLLKRANDRNYGRSRRSAFRRAQPFRDARTQGRNCDSTKALRTQIEPAQCPPQQRDRSSQIAVLEMVERRCDLNQCLQETALRLFQREPDALPMLVSQKELRSPITGKSLGKGSMVPLKRHVFRIMDIVVSETPLQQQRILTVSSPIESPKASTGIGTPCRVFQMRRAAAPTTRITAAIKIAISTESK